MLYLCLWFFFFKQKTAYDMCISDWSSDVCSSDLNEDREHLREHVAFPEILGADGDRVAAVGAGSGQQADQRQEYPGQTSGGRMSGGKMLTHVLFSPGGFQTLARPTAAPRASIGLGRRRPLRIPRRKPQI